MASKIAVVEERSTGLTMAIHGRPRAAVKRHRVDCLASALPFEICKGVVLGLYRIRDTRGDEFPGWAEDFPTEAAADASYRSSSRRRKQGARAPDLLRAYPSLRADDLAMAWAFVDGHARGSGVAAAVRGSASPSADCRGLAPVWHSHV